MILNVLAQTGGGLGGLILPIAFIGLFYFMMIRPQQQKQKKDDQMRKELKKNDEVVTIGGLHGTVTYTGEKTIKLKISEHAVVTVDKSAVASKKSSSTEVEKSEA